MFKKTFDFVLFSSFFVAACAVALCMETNLQLHQPLDTYNFYFFIFGATLVQYNLHYLIKTTANPHSERLAWSKKNKVVHWIMIIAGTAIIIYSVMSFELNKFIFLFILGIITFLYSFPVLPFKYNRRLKDFGMIKIIVLTLLWTLITVWLPVDDMTDKLFFWMVFAQRFCFMFAICLVFDVRDIETDKGKQIETIPVRIGEAKSYLMADIFLVFYCLLSAALYFEDHKIIYLIAMLISAAATKAIIEYTKKNKSDYVYLSGIDGMMLLQGLLVLISSV